LFHRPQPLSTWDVTGFSGTIMRPGAFFGKLCRLSCPAAFGWHRRLEIREAVTFKLRVGRAGCKTFRAGGQRRRRLTGTPGITAAVASPRANRGSSSTSPRRLGNPRFLCDGTEFLGGRKQSPFRTAFDFRRFETLLLEARKRSRGRQGRRGRGSSTAPAPSFTVNEGLGRESFSKGPLALFVRLVCLGHAWRGALTAPLFRLVVAGGRRRLGKPCSLGAAGREVRINRFRRPHRSPARFFWFCLAVFTLAVAFPVEIPISLSIRIPFPPGCLGPRGRLGCKWAERWVFQVGWRQVRRGRFERGWSGARGIDLVVDVLLVPQSLAEAARHFRSISAPAHRPIRALPLSLRAPSLPVSVLGPWWSRQRRGKGFVGRFGS
jgi:hypothetical protein